MAPPGISPELLRGIVNTLVNVTCNGEPVSSLYGCVADGIVCSNHGTCNAHQCSCNMGYEGTFCQTIQGTSHSSSNSGTIIGIVIGTLLFI